MRAKLVMLMMLAASTCIATACESGPSYHVSSSIAISDADWDYASFDPRLHRLYVSREAGVLAVDVDTGRVISTFIPGQKTHSTVVVPGGRLVVTNGGSNTVTVADARTGRAIAVLKAGEKPDGAVYDPATRLVFAMDKTGGDIGVVDPGAARGFGRIEVGGTLEFPAVDGRGKLFVNVEDQGLIAVIDTRTRAILGRYKLAGCEEPTGLAYVSRHDLLVAACGNGVAEIVDARTGRLVRRASIGPNPDAVIYDSRRDVIAIPTAGSLEVDGELTQLDGAGTVLRRVPTKRGARTGALDPATGRYYLPAATYRAGPDGHPETTPGTFTILVVSR